MRTILLARGRIDAALGRVTPVVLLLTVLAAFLIVAVLFGALGLLPIDPLATAATFALALAGTAIGGGLGAAILRVRSAWANWPQLESTLATGLILGFLFTPRLELPALLGVGLAGILAGASKYLLAWRGRHLLNPAAFGAAAIGVSGLAVPTWWIGSEALLPIVALGALLVATRAGALGPAVLTVVIAAGSTAAALLAFGLPLSQALVLPFTSFGTIFLAGIMLTEPLTLPPRRGARFLVAALVGALLGLPLVLAASGAAFPIAPEIALLIGNLLAWAFGQRRGLRFEVLGQRAVGDRVYELRLRPLTPVRHEAGQAIELAVPHRRPDLRGRLRAFSILSAPGAPELEIAYGVPAESSSLKRALLALQPGDRLTATRVLGDFTLPRNPAVPVLLVAGGIGITPFVSMVRSAAGAGGGRDIVVVHRASDPVYADEFAAVPGVRFVPFYEARPDADALLAAVPDLASRTAYVSGPPGMVAALSAMLRRAGVRRIRRDVFSGA